MYAKHLKQCLQALPREAKLWVAVSGGLDSVVLLRLLAGVLPRERLGVVHVNHGLRGEESDGDEAFVAKLAGNLGLAFECFTLTWAPDEKRSQATARAKRLACFGQILVDPRAWIATAHHANDLAETVFQRLLRGTGPRGLLPMRTVNKKTRILRPLLSLSRAEILVLASQNRWKWREDSSNRRTKYERNWLRQEIFPKLEARRPGFQKRIVALAEDVAKLRTKGKKISSTRIAGAEIFSAAALQRASAEQVIKIFSCERRHLPQLEKIIREGGKCHVPKGHVWSSCGWVLWGELNSGTKVLPGKFESVLGAWDLPAGSVVRSRLVGDGLKKKFINRKVPAFLRAAVPVVGGEALLPRDFSQAGQWKSTVGKVEFRPSPLATRLFRAASSAAD